jgi:acetyltransferase
MSTYRLDKVMRPRSVVLVGASPREGSLGRHLLRNLRDGGFEGPIGLVNPRYREIDGMACLPSLDALPQVPDLMICTAPPQAVPGLLDQAGRLGVAGAVVITAGLGHGPGSLGEEARLAARAHGLRLIGPNCLGLMTPSAKLNASFASRTPQAGDLALVSQSGAIAAGLIEWAASRNIGFSSIVSLGDKADVDFGDCLDFFALDRNTRAILLYIESIGDARKFLTAARAAARVKPVVVVKSGRHAAGAKAAATHTGALAGSDAVYEAVFRRAGLLRVLDLDELFAAAETLSRRPRLVGPRLSVLTNGGGVGVLAVDRLADLGGTLATLTPETLAALDAVLPATWSKGNPVDIIGDADAVRYGKSLEILLEDKGTDAVLVLNVPTALASPSEAAHATADAVEGHRKLHQRGKPVFAAWIGEPEVAADRFEAAMIPHYATGADAVQGFMHLVRHAAAQEALLETPERMPEEERPDPARVRAIVSKVLDEKRAWLDPIEVGELLTLYGIPNAAAQLARDPEEAAEIAAPMLEAGTPVAVKILSPDIVHKSDVGGVRLDLASRQAVREAAQGILERAGSLRPDARITGVIVQPMIRKAKARELIAGVADDPTFGPVIVFGRGGTAVEVINDKAIGLPPLDMKLARDLIAGTRVSRILKAYRDVPAADGTAVAQVLVKLSQLVEDLPEVLELDINPLLADETGVIAVDARVRVGPVAARAIGSRWHPRLSIRPYPREWERESQLPDGTAIHIRPVRPEDEPLFRAFLGKVTAHDLRLRFFSAVKDFDHGFIARLTQLDYARAIAFIAVDAQSGEMLGVVRLHADANHRTGEYAIMVRSDLKGHGLGWTLMRLMIDWAQAEGMHQVTGQVLAQNVTMLAMCEKLGFRAVRDPDDAEVRVVTLELSAPLPMDEIPDDSQPETPRHSSAA